MLLNRIYSGLLITGLNLYCISHANAFGWHHGIGVGVNHISSDADIEFYDKNSQQTQQLNEHFKADSFSQQIDNAAAIEGYSTNHEWLFNYSLAQYNTQANANEQASYKLTGTHVSAALGHRLFEANQNIRLYGLLGGQYRKQKFTHRLKGISQNKFSESEFTPIAGLQLDVPLSKNVVAHLKTQVALNSDHSDTSSSLGINLRVNSSMSLLAEYEISQFELESGQKNQPGYYHFDGDVSQISLKAVFIW